MARSLILPIAEDDIVHLFEFHLDHSDRTANAFADAVIEVVRRLELFPESGAPREHIAKGLRVVPVQRFRANVFYAVTKNGHAPLVTVLRVLRQERRVSRTDFE